MSVINWAGGPQSVPDPDERIMEDELRVVGPDEDEDDGFVFLEGLDNDDLRDK